MARKMVCMICKGKGKRRSGCTPELFVTCFRCNGMGAIKYVRSPHVKTTKARKRVKRMGICKAVSANRKEKYVALKRGRHFGPMMGWETEK